MVSESMGLLGEPALAIWTDDCRRVAKSRVLPLWISRIVSGPDGPIVAVESICWARFVIVWLWWNQCTCSLS